jgi:hypothetical protein
MITDDSGEITYTTVEEVILNERGIAQTANAL